MILCVIQSDMDLFWVMLVKGVVLLTWAVVSEWFWPEKPDELLDEEGSGYSPAYSPLRLPPPEDAT